MPLETKHGREPGIKQRRLSLDALATTPGACRDRLTLLHYVQPPAWHLTLAAAVPNVELGYEPVQNLLARPPSICVVPWERYVKSNGLAGRGTTRGYPRATKSLGDFQPRDAPDGLTGSWYSTTSSLGRHGKPGARLTPGKQTYADLVGLVRSAGCV